MTVSTRKKKSFFGDFLLEKVSGLVSVSKVFVMRPFIVSLLTDEGELNK